MIDKIKIMIDKREFMIKQTANLKELLRDFEQECLKDLDKLVRSSALDLEFHSTQEYLPGKLIIHNVCSKTKPTSDTGKQELLNIQKFI